MRLEPYSAWPVPWDTEVQKVVQKARELGIEKLRVKVKLGTLRIQEGGEELAETIAAADRATQIICPACGGVRARQQGVTLQLCASCQAQGNTGPGVQWIEQLNPDQLGPKAVTLHDVDRFTYPTHFTVVGHYAATGEGVTVHLLMAYAHDTASLRRLVDAHIEPYFSSRAEYFEGLVLLEEFEDLVPPKVRAFVNDPSSIRGNLIYFSKFHLNRS